MVNINQKFQNVPRNQKIPMMLIDADIQRTQLLGIRSHTMDGTAQDAVKSVTVSRDSYLKGISLAVSAAISAVGELYNVEISKSGNCSTDAAAENSDTLVILSQHIQGGAAGAITNALNQFIPTKVFFRSGEKVYLNIEGTNGRDIDVFAVLFWEDLVGQTI